MSENPHRFASEVTHSIVPEANFVRLRHAGDSVATYAHPFPRGVHVAPGQQVTAGMVIGRSGATGDARGRRLHFIARQTIPDQGILD